MNGLKNSDGPVLERPHGARSLPFFPEGVDASMITIEKNGVHVVHITNHVLYDDEEVLVLQRKIDRLLESQPVRSLVLDFELVQAAGSAGLSLLLHVRKKCEEGGCPLGISGLNPIIQEVLEVTKLQQMFRIRETADCFTQEGSPPK